MSNVSLAHRLAKAGLFDKMAIYERYQRRVPWGETLEGALFGIQSQACIDIYVQWSCRWMLMYMWAPMESEHVNKWINKLSFLSNNSNNYSCMGKQTKLCQIRWIFTQYCGKIYPRQVDRSTHQLQIANKDSVTWLKKILLHEILLETINIVSKFLCL